MRIYVALFCAGTAFAAVDGSVTDGTTGKPAAGVDVSLVAPSQRGMQTLATAKSDASGKFAFTQTPKGPTLVQASYQGVTYSKMIMPGAPSTGLQVQVYDSTRKPVAQVSQHMILIQPTASDLNVSETFLLQGDPKLTYIDPENGTVRLYLPKGFKGDLTVQATGPGGMPIARPAEKTKTPNVYKVDYPIRPGETRIDVTYSVPTTGNPPVLEGKVLHKEGKTRLVTPNGVTLKAANITELGKEPQSQASIYDLNGDSYKVEVNGTGSLQPMTDTSQEEDAGQPQITQEPPHIYHKMYWIMGLSFAILGLGTYLLASRAVPAPKK
ncbi:MAG: carboxypeptidase regulatory-like domain-containing protein [Acidobacteriaceae bacterium]|nr:carboxypeptidase regulatory-like domain-containing protein [Acidobacteriaceae bacterium]